MRFEFEALITSDTIRFQSKSHSKLNDSEIAIDPYCIVDNILIPLIDYFACANEFERIAYVVIRFATDSWNFGF